jgi:hypothetical protein
MGKAEDYAGPVRRLVLATAVLAAVSAAVAAAGWGGGQAAAAVCTVAAYPGLPPHHVQSLSAKPKYDSFPPTSGTHYYLTAKWDIYTFALPQIALVHNLEHGGIVVQYGNRVPKATVARIRSWYLADSTGLVVAPLPRLGAKIVLGAWNAPPYKSGRQPEQQDPGHGYLDACTGFDARAFTAFVKQHRFKGGERFPPALLKRSR